MADSKNTQQKIKLSYVANQFKVKVELTRAACLATPTAPPLDIVKRAQAKMETIKAEKKILFYKLNLEEYKLFWKTVASDKSIRQDRRFLFTLAEGVPPLEGVEVKPVEGGKAIASISIDAPAKTVLNWRIDWLELFVNQSIRNREKPVKVNSSQVAGCWYRAAAGQSITDIKLSPQPPRGSPEEVADKPYSIIANKARHEIAIIIRDLRAVSVDLSPQEMLRVIKDAANKVSRQFGGNYFLLKRELTSELKQASVGPAAVGLQMPLVILGACSINSNEIRSSVDYGYPGCGTINIKVADDGLAAFIYDFDMSLYTSADFALSEEWLLKEMKRYGLTKASSAAYIKDLMAMIEANENLEGVQIAEGDKGSGGVDPYLHPVYRETAKTNVEHDENVDLRSLQQRSIAKKGQLIAEIRYRGEARIGKDVYGNDMEAQTNENLKIIDLGGIKQRGNGKFYAAMDGVPVIDLEKNKIGVSQIMIHKGDVNLRTGNIVFDGPVEVTGSIESGARVEVNGELVVKGGIRGGSAIAKGDIVVHNGIVTGPKQRVSAGGDIQAEFIENSSVECSGNVTVKKAIINSEVIVGATIKITDKVNGVLAGGYTACRENIYTANLAFKNGTKTYLNVGADWHIERKVRIKRKRLEKLEELNVTDRQALRELLSRKNQGSNTKVQEKKDYYQLRLQKERVLIDKAKALLQKAQALLVYNPHSKVFISNVVYANCDIQIGGGPAVIPQDMAGIAILAKRRQGSKVVTIEVGQKIEEEESAYK